MVQPFEESKDGPERQGAWSVFPGMFCSFEIARTVPPRRFCGQTLESIGIPCTLNGSEGCGGCARRCARRCVRMCQGPCQARGVSLSACPRLTIGQDALGQILVVVYTERGRGFRLISARRATHKERSDLPLMKRRCGAFCARSFGRQVEDTAHPESGARGVAAEKEAKAAAARKRVASLLAIG